jgi:hypothetical protein
MKNKFKYPKSTELLRENAADDKLLFSKSAVLNSENLLKVNNLAHKSTKTKTGEADSDILNEFDNQFPESHMTEGPKIQVMFKSMSLLNSGVNAQSSALMINPKGSLSLKKTTIANQS